MSYFPKKGTNIANIFDCITNTKQTVKEIENQVRKTFPQVPIGSLSIHIKFLMKKGLVIKVGDCYVLPNSQQTIFNEPLENEIIQPVKNGSVKSRLIEYCKNKIGKKVTTVEIKTKLNLPERTSSVITILGDLQEKGAVQRVPNTYPHEFLVLPQIKIADRKGLVPVKQAIKKPKKEEIKVEPRDDVLNLSIGQLLSERMTLKDENRRLKETLQRMAHELFQIGEVES